MSRAGGSTPARFVGTYLAVFALMVGWWLGLQAATSLGPALTVLVAYAGPAIAWVVIGVPFRQRRSGA